jgi:hypothetical protein
MYSNEHITSYLNHTINQTLNDTQHFCQLRFCHSCDQPCIAGMTKSRTWRAFHPRERSMEIFRNCYDDHRTIKKVLDTLTKHSRICQASHTNSDVDLQLDREQKTSADSRVVLSCTEPTRHENGRTTEPQMLLSCVSLPHHGSKDAPAKLHDILRKILVYRDP